MFSRTPSCHFQPIRSDFVPSEKRKVQPFSGLVFVLLRSAFIQPFKFLSALCGTVVEQGSHCINWVISELQWIVNAINKKNALSKYWWTGKRERGKKQVFWYKNQFLPSLNILQCKECMKWGVCVNQAKRHSSPKRDWIVKLFESRKRRADSSWRAALKRTRSLVTTLPMTVHCCHPVAMKRKYVPRFKTTCQCWQNIALIYAFKYDTSQKHYNTALSRTALILHHNTSYFFLSFFSFCSLSKKKKKKQKAFEEPRVSVNRTLCYVTNNILEHVTRNKCNK